MKVTEDAVPRSDDLADYYSAFGRYVIAWNGLEATARLMIYGLAGGGGARTDILSAHIHVQTIEPTLTALADTWPAELRGHVYHLAECFRREREWRNFYVHGVRLVGHSNNMPFGFIQQSAIKSGKLILEGGGATIEDVRTRSTSVGAIKRYADQIIPHIWSSDTVLPECQPLSSLEKPPTPLPVRKNRASLPLD